MIPNNPFNLRYNPRNRWQGQCGSLRGFCVFDDLDHCVRAVAICIMRSYRKAQVRTYSQIISRYAPKSDDNPTQVYLQFILDHVHKFPWDEPRSLDDFANLLYYIVWFEQGSPGDLLGIIPMGDSFFYYLKSVLVKYKIVPYGLKR